MGHRGSAFFLGRTTHEKTRSYRHVSVDLSACARAVRWGKVGSEFGSGISPTTADFVKGAAIDDIFEIQSSELAAYKGNEQTKGFANQMITDHQNTTNALNFHGSNRQGGGERSIYTRQLSPENAGQAKESEWLRLQQAI